MSMYRVFEVKNGRCRKVYEGTVDPDIIMGKSTLQAQPFGRLYHVDGCVLRSDDDLRPVCGVICQFERVAA